MNSPGYRVTQRRPQACQECTKRKRKCDKELPCGRCRRLKIECTRETVRLRNLSAKHADEISFLESLKADIVAGQRHDPAVVRKIDNRLSYLQFGASVSPAPSAPQESESVDLPAKSQSGHDSSSSGTLIDPMSAEPKDADASILTALEYLAWGRSLGSCFPHLTCACQHHRGIRTATDGSGSSSLYRLATDLPRPSDAKRLVEFHIRYLAWHHNCLHSTTFLDQCEIFWRTGQSDRPQWLALYLSVLSSTVYCVQNSRRFSTELGLELNLISAHKLFKNMLDVLYSEDFLGDVSLYSVQAIVISTEVAHNLGFSQLNAILIGAAIRIAQCLGLHKIASRDPASVKSNVDWAELVDLEVGKRIWCQMLIQDLFAIPFNDSYGILPLHCSTDVPMNCDDDLVAKDPDVPTVSSFGRVLVQLALLMPEMAEGLGPVKKRKPLQQQYEHILRMDQKMRETVRQIPSFLLREDSGDHSRTPWLSIARRSLAITAADKIIMIHRPFLFRAFQSEAYAYTRRTCVAAAMTILREHEAIAQSDDLSIWTHTAFCITATVILSFEISYRINTGDGDVDGYRRAVQAARDRLVARHDDVLAARGVTLIDVVSLEETAVTEASVRSPDPPKIIDLPRVVQKFFAANNFDAFQDSLGASIEGSAFDLDVGLDGQYLNGMPVLPDMHDFDEWFNNTFNEGQGDIAHYT